MLDDFLDKLKVLVSSRLIPLSMIFILMFMVLVNRIFSMQIVEGATAADTEEYKTTYERDIKSTRGNIYDRNGVLLAYNELRYAVVMSQSAQLTSNNEINEMIYNLVMLLEKYGNKLELDFCIDLDENGELQFNVSGNAELRFKKNAYQLKGTSFLTDEQINATAAEVFNFLKRGSGMYGISDRYSVEDALKIMTVRYTMRIQVPQYDQFTLASDISNETVAAIKENLADLPGVEIQQQTYRVYNDAGYFAHIVGYTGLINTTELEKYNENLETAVYKSNDYVGKKGIEKSMEEYLSGTKGTVQVVVNNSSKVLSTTISAEPEKGNDVYLSIDRDLQIACYHILEKNLAAILKSKIL